MKTKRSNWRIMCLCHREEIGVSRHYFVYHTRTAQTVACDDLPHAESVLRQKDAEDAHLDRCLKVLRRG